MGEALPLSLEMIIVLIILLFTLYLFVFEVVRVDVAAMTIMILLGIVTLMPWLDPILSIDKLFSGFSSNAVISVIAVMIIGAGLDKTGLMNQLAGYILKRGGKTDSRIISLVCSAVGLISSFMQNIGAAALFLPVVNRIATRTNIPASRLLMPMGFCAILGGTVSMIGSSPLILLNDLLLSANQALPEEDRMDTFGLFSVTPIGLALIASGIIYFVLAGKKVLPAAGFTKSKTTTEALEYFQRVYGIQGQFMEARVTLDSPMAAMTIQQIEANYWEAPTILAIYDGEVTKVPPDREEVIWVNTVVGIMGEPSYLQDFCEKYHWELRDEPERFADVLNAHNAGIGELVVPPSSSLIGKAIKDIKPRRNLGINILQIIRDETVIERDFSDVELRRGDTLAVHTTWRDLAKLRNSRDFVVATDHPYEETRPDKAKFALICFCIALSLFVLTDKLSVSLFVGALGMILTGVLTIDEAYQSVSWQTVFLLASLIPLGMAVEQSGTAAWMAYQILSVVGDMPIWGLQAVIALLATVFTLVMSNIGATVLLVPLAINIALVVGADPAMFALTVAISTSNSFLIPTHQVNALLMGPGGYRVKDFVRAGAPMTLLFLLVSLLMMNLVF